MDRFASLYEKYATCFRYDHQSLRTIGLEKEIHAVNHDGFIVNVSKKIWPHLKRQGFRYYLDSGYRDQINGFFVGKEQITTDAGIGTFEIIITPSKTVQEAEKKMKKLLAVLFEACEKEKVKMVALGVQPRTKPSIDFWNKKQRYDLILDQYKHKVLPSCISASDQAHIDVGREEFVSVVNSMNGLTGFMIVLFSNSPLKHGRLLRFRAYREFIWDNFSKTRTGVPSRMFTSMDDYLRMMWELPCIVAKKDNGDFFAPNMKFKEYIKKFRTNEEIFEAFTIHEGTVWFSSRPRVYGTIEVRPAGLQPWENMVALGAFAAGAVENHQEIETFLRQFRWKELRALRYEAAVEGFDLRLKGKPVSDFLQEILQMVEKGLKVRKRKEEAYLAPLWERLARRQAPVERNREYYRSGGIPLLLKKTSLQRKHLT